MPNDDNQTLNLRPEVQKFLRFFGQTPTPEPSPEEVIQVSSATKRIAFAYERFRNTLEPDEEEILRRRAILRIIERRLFEDRPPVAIATSLLQELIRGNYIKPPRRSHAVQLAAQLKKAKQIYAGLSAPQAEWFLNLVAVAIDHHLFPPHRQEALVHLMYHDTFKRIAWADNYVAAKERPTQLYLACHRALFAADKYELAYHYFQHHFPAWNNPELSTEEIDQVIKGLPAFQDYIEATLNHRSNDRLTRFLRPIAVPYLVLRDLFEQNDPAALASKEAFLQAAQAAITDRFQLTKSRMNKRAWHSILFLFMTKTLLAIFIEVPYESIVLKEVHGLALLTNITFHPLLLFFLATTVRLPGAANTERIIDQLQRITTGEGELGTIGVSSPRHYGTTTWSAFAIIYVILFLFIFWFLFSILDRLDFSLLAMFFFVVFLGLVSFLATRIRRSVEDLRVIPRREGAISAVGSFFALPVLEFGRWLAQNIRQINVLLFFMDRVLEAPFKLLIDISEEWFDFVRDRREEIVK